MKNKLKELIKEQIKKSFMPEYQSKATDEEALGIMISQFSEWDGLFILKVASSALEDANFHTENRLLAEMIDRLEKEAA